MLYVVLFLTLIIVVVLAKVFAIISGYGAKIVCSGVFVCDRTLDDLVKNELASFPLSLGRCTVNIHYKTVTCTVFGLAKKKAVYREGVGATLLNKISEEQFRAQQINFATPPLTNRVNETWPQGNNVSRIIKPNFNEQQLNDALAEAFREPPNEVRRTRAVVVVYNGEIVAEKYAPGFSAASKLAGWSMAKSITNASIGILVKQHKLDIHAPAPVNAWKNDGRNKITIADLLQMSSGLRWWEYYAAPSDATNMLYNAKSMGAFAMQKPLKHQPGTIFNYSSGSTNILSYIIRQAVGDADYYRFPYEQLFYKIGMHSAVMEADAGGTFAGSSYCYATARDWARFGLLYLNDGIWNNERILPEGWVKFTTTPTAAKSTPEEGSFGAQFWLNAPYTNNPAERKYPHVPADCFRCQGYEGQYIWIIPSEKLVVVRLALEKNNSLNPDVFLPSVIAAFKNLNNRS